MHWYDASQYRVMHRPGIAGFRHLEDWMTSSRITPEAIKPEARWTAVVTAESAVIGRIAIEVPDAYG